MQFPYGRYTKAMVLFVLREHDDQKTPPIRKRRVAKNTEKVGVINEAADLLYHVMVLLNAKDVKISEVCSELCKRNR